MEHWATCQGSQMEIGNNMNKYILFLRFRYSCFLGCFFFSSVITCFISLSLPCYLSFCHCACGLWGREGVGPQRIFFLSLSASPSSISYSLYIGGEIYFVVKATITKGPNTREHLITDYIKNHKKTKEIIRFL